MKGLKAEGFVVEGSRGFKNIGVFSKSYACANPAVWGRGKPKWGSFGAGLFMYFSELRESEKARVVRLVRCLCSQVRTCFMLFICVTLGCQLRECAMETPANARRRGVWTSFI